MAVVRVCPARVRGALRAVALAAGAAMIVSGCATGSGSLASSGPEAADVADRPAAVGQRSAHTAEIEGTHRDWETYVPPDLRSVERGGAPVMVVFHGSGDSVRGLRAGLSDEIEAVAREHGFVVAYPNGYDRNWNECRIAGSWAAKERDVDDPGLVRTIIDRAEADLGEGSVDRRSVFAVGFSAGGHMAMRLALEEPDLVSGVAAVSANVPTEDNQGCTDVGVGVPAMFIQGVQDRINPFDGGEVSFGLGVGSRGDVLSARQGAQWFADRNQAQGPRSVDPAGGDGVSITEWPGESPVRLVVIEEGGHSFPTRSGPFGNDGTGAHFDGPGAIWEFFDSVSR